MFSHTDLPRSFMPDRTPNILLLGGTTEASLLARALSASGLRACFSYAGRVKDPRIQPLPTRVGGFGGVDGLVRYLTEQGITHLIDATHPFAAQMSTHAIAAARIARVPLLALTRPPWTVEPGDRWHQVANIDAAVAALTGPPQRILLALGRMHLAEFATQAQHHYVLRLVDPPSSAIPLPDHHVMVDRGPFTLEGDLALLQRHRIELVVSKNAGGEGARAKLLAARQLGVPVLMVERPALPPRNEVHTVDAVLDWLTHHTPAGTERGV
ncbi:cobalt-precorrin-6A reductase [Azoarcus communis]|nr:cobalt-precorrin-6A reductase [Parazoarcus communis]